MMMSVSHRSIFYPFWEKAGGNQMIQRFADNQNWAKLTPWMGVATTALLFWCFNSSDAMFWALVNIPLYLFHQAEEHLWPGGFKQYMNSVIYEKRDGVETLTDEKIFWINILLVWVSFALFGSLTLLNIGFGLLIIVFSIMNCVAHIIQGIIHKEWNPGLVVASAQFLISIYGAYFITTHGLTSRLSWWIGALMFSGVVHALLFKRVMKTQ
jgi:hypothetical protein